MDANMTLYKFPSSRVFQPALKETILCSALQLIEFISVWLRLWSRRIKRNPLGTNDYTILAALFFSTGMLGTAIACKDFYRTQTADGTNCPLKQLY
jgi:hypothetical protein